MTLKGIRAVRCYYQKVIHELGPRTNYLIAFFSYQLKKVARYFGIKRLFTKKKIQVFVV